MGSTAKNSCMAYESSLSEPVQSEIQMEESSCCRTIESFGFAVRRQTLTSLIYKTEYAREVYDTYIRRDTQKSFSFSLETENDHSANCESEIRFFYKKKKRRREKYGPSILRLITKKVRRHSMGAQTSLKLNTHSNQPLSRSLVYLHFHALSVQCKM